MTTTTMTVVPTITMANSQFAGNIKRKPSIQASAHTYACTQHTHTHTHVEKRGSIEQL